MGGFLHRQDCLWIVWMFTYRLFEATGEFRLRRRRPLLDVITLQGDWSFSHRHFVSLRSGQSEAASLVGNSDKYIHFLLERKSLESILMEEDFM